RGSCLLTLYIFGPDAEELRLMPSDQSEALVVNSIRRSYDGGLFSFDIDPQRKASFREIGFEAVQLEAASDEEIRAFISTKVYGAGYALADTAELNWVALDDTADAT